MADIAYWNASNPAVTPDGRLSPAFSRFLNEITRQFSPELDTGIEIRLTNVEAVNATQDGLITANTAAIATNAAAIAANVASITALTARVDALEAAPDYTIQATYPGTTASTIFAEYPA